MADNGISNTSRALFGVHADALVLRHERMQIIASNLANADTPNYQARDINFAAALQTAAGQAAPETARRTDAKHLAATTIDPHPTMVYRVPTQPGLDGNTVDTNTEHAAFARAAMEYRASLQFVEGRASTMITALTGQ